MLIGNLLTIVVSFCIGIVGTLVYFKWRHIHSRYKNSLTHSFALFWLAMSFAWYCTALSNWWRYVGYIGVAARIVYPLQFFLGISLVLAVYFANAVLLEGRHKRKIVFLYIIFLFTFLYTLFKYDLGIPREAFFSGHIVSPLPTRVIFLLMFVPLWIMAICILYRSLIRNTPLDRQLRLFEILASSSLVVLGGAGVFDELGIVNDWAVTFARIIMLTSALAAYGAITALEDPEELVV